MKKLIMSASLVLSLFAYDTPLPKQEADKILQNSVLGPQIKTKFKHSKIFVVKKENFYIVTIRDKRGEGTFCLTPDLKYTILGQVINNKSGRPLTINLPLEKFSGDKKVVEEGIVFSFGKGDKDLYIVTDPECPFCRRFERIAEKSHLADKYRIHIIFLPLSFHKHSKDMIYYILSADTDQEKAKRFRETLTGSNKWETFKPSDLQKAKIDKELKKSLKAVNELGARGTPTFYDENLTEIKNRGQIFK